MAWRVDDDRAYVAALHRIIEWPNDVIASESASSIQHGRHHWQKTFWSTASLSARQATYEGALTAKKFHSSLEWDHEDWGDSEEQHEEHIKRYCNTIVHGRPHVVGETVYRHISSNIRRPGAATTSAAGVVGANGDDNDAYGNGFGRVTVIAENEDEQRDITYSHMTRILERLKGYRKHSEPFLSRVSKRDAPDYHDVIQTPMDLSIISRKLRNKEYAGEEDFVADVNLVFNNCRFYNRDPKNVYHQHANAMDIRFQSLLAEAPVAVLEYKADHDDDTLDIEGANVLAATGAAVDGNEVEEILGMCGPPPPLDEVRTRSATRALRMYDMAHRHKQLELPLCDRFALVRSAQAMGEFVALKENGASDFTLADIALASAVPPLWNPPQYDPIPLDCEATAYAVRVRGLPNPILRNIRTLTHLRDMRGFLLDEEEKLNKSRNGDSSVCLGCPPPLLDVVCGGTVLAAAAATATARKKNVVALDRPTAATLMRRSVGALLAHTGFESASNAALAMLADEAERFFMRLGRVARAIADTPKHGTNDQGEECLLDFVSILDAASAPNGGIAGALGAFQRTVIDRGECLLEADELLDAQLLRLVEGTTGCKEVKEQEEEEREKFARLMGDDDILFST